MSASSSKTEKLGDGIREKQGINRLPDDILVHILSFLSTREAVKTSVLSKRWENLWVSMPHFFFFDTFVKESSRKKGWYQILESGPSIFTSIERALFLRNASCLKNFKLQLSKHVDASRLHLWVSVAVKQNVEKLALQLHEQGEFVLPDSLFTSESLTAFELQVRGILKVPNFICFSGLAGLSLQLVEFQDEQSIRQLLSGCPLLEDLRLVENNWENIREVTIDNPTLKSLIFTDNGNAFPMQYFLNCKIIIAASNLETLLVIGNMNVELLPRNLRSLKSAIIDINKWNGEQERSRRIVELVSGLQYVRSLKLSTGTLELPLLFVKNLEERLPTFCNMTELCGEVYFPTLSDYTTGALVYILNKSPNLETLRLPGGFRTWELHMMLQTIPYCFQSCLKSFIIYNVDGSEEDICLLMYVRQNAPVLQQLTMMCSKTFSEELEKQEEIYQQLVQLRGGSAAGCSIKFLPYEDETSLIINPNVEFVF